MLIYLIAGEPSGDMIGARLMRALKRQVPDVKIIGIGGENMEKEGLKSLFDISDLAIMGLAEVIPSIPKVLRHIKETVADVEKNQPDAVITIDSWSFSARVHKAIRAKHIKVLQMHYVAPQVWAWKKGRAKTMYKYIDHLLTLFPNEPKYFTPYRLPTDFVGHPVVESSMINAKAEDFLTKYKIGAEEKVVLLLPGSRHNEVARLLPVFLEVADDLKQRHPELKFVIPTVKTVAGRVKEMLKLKGKEDILVLETQEDRYAAAQASVMAIAASGTVALELAVVNVPHLVAYKVPALTAFLARLITDIKYVNLTNILLDKPIIPEMIQENCTKEKLAAVAEELLDKKSALSLTEQKGFKELQKALGMGELKPSEKAAKIILNLIKKEA